MLKNEVHMTMTGTSGENKQVDVPMGSKEVESSGMTTTVSSLSLVRAVFTIFEVWNKIKY